MKKSIAAVSKITGALALAGGVIMMATLPAVAAGPTNQAYAASAFGRIYAPRIALATYPTGTHHVTLPHIGIPGLLTAWIVTDKAGPTRASSNVLTPRVRLTRLTTLSAKAVYSSCKFHTRTGMVSGYTKITYGAVRSFFRTIPLPWHPAPNTTIYVPGVAKIVLNRQTTAPNGTLTVTAIYVSLRHIRQTLRIATSVCNRARLAPVPILPGKTLPLTVGGLGVLLIGGMGYRVTRRRLAAAA
jgi:fructose-specific phosphotransferase system IIC component